MAYIYGLDIIPPSVTEIYETGGPQWTRWRLLNQSCICWHASSLFMRIRSTYLFHLVHAYITRKICLSTSILRNSRAFVVSVCVCVCVRACVRACAHLRLYILYYCLLQVTADLKNVWSGLHLYLHLSLDRERRLGHHR